MERLTPPADRRDLRLALLVALVAFVVYNVNLRLIDAGDTYPARFLPFALWEHSTLYLDDLRTVVVQKRTPPYWLVAAPGGHWASLYPVVTPLLVAPLYGPAVFYLDRVGWSYENVSRAGALMEKIAGSCVASLAVGLMYLLLRRRLEWRDALLLTGAFAFGTNTWTVSSQALWQHGPAELFLVAALWFLTGEPSRTNLLAAGFATGLLAANRPPDVLLAAGLGLFALAWALRRAVLFVLAAAVPAGLALAYNLIVFQNPGGGYGAAGVAQLSFFARPILPGVAGLLLSPGQGLFVFSPFLVFLPLLFRRSLRDRQDRLLNLLLAASVAAQVVFYAATDWRAGVTFGPRFLTDVVPILIWLLAPVLASLGERARVAFACCCLFSVWVQLIGAFQFTGISSLVFAEEMRNVWYPRNAGFLLEAHNKRQPAELLGTLRSLAHPVPPSRSAMPPLAAESPPSARVMPPIPPGPRRASHPSDFYPVTACVLLDTRLDLPLDSQEPARTFRVTGRCGIPGSAVALAANVVVREASRPGGIRLFPDGPGQSFVELGVPQGPSAAAVILPLAADGRGTLAVTTDIPGAQVRLEVSGYFCSSPP